MLSRDSTKSTEVTSMIVGVGEDMDCSTSQYNLLVRFVARMRVIRVVVWVVERVVVRG